MGVCMPDKKLIPLSLMPLDLELTLNPFALYGTQFIGDTRDSNVDGLRGVDASIMNRSYQIENMELFSHVLFFE